MTRKLPFFLFPAVFLLAVQPVSAWNGTGHMVSATLVYKRLSVESKSAVDRLLTAHPAYSEWKRLHSENRQSPEFEGISLELFAFQKASVWPDEIRGSKSPLDHAMWHFVDYPFPGRAVANPRSPFPTDDILTGLAVARSVLENDRLPDDIRAVQLSWIIHLLGDIHQPLHCATGLSRLHPSPLGDYGGNSVFIKSGDEAMSLHKYWDNLIGPSPLSKNPAEIVLVAARLETEFEGVDFPEIRSARTPKAWSLESYRIAAKTVYLNGRLRTGDKLERALSLPRGYAERAEKIGRRRLMLAVRRMEAVLQNNRQQK